MIFDNTVNSSVQKEMFASLVSLYGDARIMFDSEKQRDRFKALLEREGENERDTFQSQDHINRQS